MKEIKGSIGRLLNNKGTFKATVDVVNTELKTSTIFVECDLKTMKSFEYQRCTGRLFEIQASESFNFKSLKNILSTDFKITENLEDKESKELKDILKLIWNFEKVNQVKLSMKNLKDFKIFIEKVNATSIDKILIKKFLSTTQSSFHVIDLFTSQISLEVLKSVGIFYPLPQISLYGSLILNITHQSVSQKVLLIGDSVLVTECKRLLKKITTKQIIAHESVKNVEIDEWSVSDIFIYCFKSESELEKVNQMSLFYEKPAFCFYIDQNKGHITCAIPNKSSILNLTSVFERDYANPVLSFPNGARDCCEYAYRYISEDGMRERHTLVEFLKDPKQLLEECKNERKFRLKTIESLKESLIFNIHEDKSIVKCIETAYLEFFYQFRDRSANKSYKSCIR